MKLLQGNNIELLKQLPDNSVDAVVTDPPYGLGKEPDALAMLRDWLETGHHDVKGRGFMGKAWDAFVPQPVQWREVYRVLKPGGHVLAFAGTRTQDLMALGLRLAGFEIRDLVAWVYGSGFPKSLDVSKALDKARRRDYVQAALDVGVHLPARSVTDWTKEGHAPGDEWWEQFKSGLPKETWEAIERRVIGTTVSGSSAWFACGKGDITAPATEAARQWQGWGTALKPALEPITLARKPLEGTVAENVLKWNTGAVNVDGCRVESEKLTGWGGKAAGGMTWTGENCGLAKSGEARPVAGRWPANLIHDGSEEVTELFPESKGQLAPSRSDGTPMGNAIYGAMKHGTTSMKPRGDTGSAARFFYCAKASKKDRGEGNGHPTIKPTDLMRYLCRLITPPGGVVLDPWMGSGSTGKAAKLEGFDFIGMEMDKGYFDIACARTGYKETVEEWI